jgi:hypothetical protein
MRLAGSLPTPPIHRSLALLLAAAAAATACAAPDDDPAFVDPERGDYEGVGFDSDNPGAELGPGKDDADTYVVPTDLPALTSPEVIISLEQLTVHLFDRATGFSRVYPAGVGVLDSTGNSITPDGHFRTSPNLADAWWYIPRRTSPSYFAGLPFLRIDARNSRGENTYGLHGPITETLIRDYVSHGCVRMEREDIIDLYYLVNAHALTPVTLQREPELDAAGALVDVDTSPALFPEGTAMPYGASVGPRPF